MLLHSFSVDLRSACASGSVVRALPCMGRLYEGYVFVVSVCFFTSLVKFV